MAILVCLTLLRQFQLLSYVIRRLHETLTGMGTTTAVSLKVLDLRPLSSWIEYQNEALLRVGYA
jgi:hypothetical protein